MSGSAWVRFKEIPGGILVFCSLCGRHTKRTFMAANTNYAEARAAATAHHWQHEHSPEHGAALKVFHADNPPEVSAEEKVLASIFGDSVPDDRARRRRAARAAAERTRRQSGAVGASERMGE